MDIISIQLHLHLIKLRLRFWADIYRRSGPPSQIIINIIILLCRIVNKAVCLFFVFLLIFLRLKTFDSQSALTAFFFTFNSSKSSTISTSAVGMYSFPIWCWSKFQFFLLFLQIFSLRDHGFFSSSLFGHWGKEERKGKRRKGTKIVGFMFYFVIYFQNGKINSSKTVRDIVELRLSSLEFLVLSG